MCFFWSRLLGCRIVDDTPAFVWIMTCVFFVSGPLQLGGVGALSVCEAGVGGN